MNCTNIEVNVKLDFYNVSLFPFSRLKKAREWFDFRDLIKRDFFAGNSQSFIYVRNYQLNRGIPLYELELPESYWNFTCLRDRLNDPNFQIGISFIMIDPNRIFNYGYRSKFFFIDGHFYRQVLWDHVIPKKILKSKNRHSRTVLHSRPVVWDGKTLHSVFLHKSNKINNSQFTDSIKDALLKVTLDK